MPRSFHWLSLPLLMALQTGCLPDWETYNERTAFLSDDDGDGLSDYEGDCDDNDPTAAPGLQEVCDGRDNNCDQAIDNDPIGDFTEWYSDSDGDAWGVGEPVVACGRPAEGYVNRGGDCNDSDNTISPDAAERCDGVDDDCDGAIDEEPTINTPTWYPDLDLDGYGDTDQPTTGCDAPAGYIAEKGDCDDGVPTTFPGADELCDGVDNDCDEVIDDPPLVGEGSWYPDEDGDGFGDESSTDARCSSAPGYSELPGDCDDELEDVNPDETELCDDGLDNDCDGEPGACIWPSSIDLSLKTLIKGEDTKDRVGGQGAVGDIDGDGQADLVLSADYATDGTYGSNVGYIDVFHLPVTSSMTRSSADITITGNVESGGLGYALDVADLNRDGFDDVLASAPGVAIGGAIASGRTYVMYGPITGGTTGSSAADWTLDGRDRDDYDTTGYVASIFDDINGDHYPDFVVASGWDSYSADSAGMVYLFSGGGYGSDEAFEESWAQLYGTGSDHNFGNAVTSWDSDGDGVSEVLVGAYEKYYSALYLFRTTYNGTYSSETADVRGDAEVEGRIDSLSRAVDFNGDGLDDVAVGMGQASSAYLLFGSSTLADLNLADADVTIREATTALGAFGFLVEQVGDLGQDGLPDLLVASEPSDDSYLSIFYNPGAGAAVIQETDRDVKLQADPSSDINFTTAFNAGDLTGDATDDLLIGSPSHNFTGASDAGVAYIVAGKGY